MKKKNTQSQFILSILFILVLPFVVAKKNAGDQPSSKPLLNPRILRKTRSNKNSALNQRTTLTRNLVHQTDSNITMTEHRENFFKVYDERHDYKTKTIWNSASQPVLTNFKYIILPIWWSDEDTSTSMDLSQIEGIMDENNQYYDNMSYGNIDVTYEILNQVQFTVSKASPDFDDTATATFEMLESLGYTKDSGQFDGVMLIYNVADDGPFSGAGGWGDVNSDDNFSWFSYDLSLDVTRHEVGHNFGHPHHLTSRSYRENPDEELYYDGFDMMSGGNGYEISDFHVSSKWWFGWVPDENIIMMQPEGSTDLCPSCVSEGTFTIKAMDISSSPPTSGDVFGIHIPILGSLDWNGFLYSYWLQYRAGVDGLASDGVSIHLVWFDLGNTFGASTDSLNYDAFGDTQTTLDSFVTQKCFVVEPSLKLLREQDVFSAEQIVPKVCVDSLDKGTSITVSVSFLDPSILDEDYEGVSPCCCDACNDSDDTSSSKVLPSSLFSLMSDALNRNGISTKKLESGIIAHDTLSCSELSSSYTTEIDTSYGNLFKIAGTDFNGNVEVSFCPDSSAIDSSVTAYFYDRYPHAPLDLDSPYAYGSHDSVTYSALDCCESGSSIPTDGKAKVVVVRNLEPYEFLHLTEIEIYDNNGNNVALDGTCYSRTSGYDGSPSCLNDGNSNTDCFSHSDYPYDSNEEFDFCVLEEYSEISKVIVKPLDDPEWFLSRMQNLQVEIYAGITGEDNIVDPDYAHNYDFEFIGLLDSAEIGFSDEIAGGGDPIEISVNLASSFDCPGGSSNEAFSFTSKLSNTWMLLTENTGSMIDQEKTSLTLECTLSGQDLSFYDRSVNERSVSKRGERAD